MANFQLIKKSLTNRILNQIDLDEIDRDPLGYSFVYWGFQKNNISYQIKSDIGTKIKNWKNKFLSNPQMNNFIDRNITTLFFIFDRIDGIPITKEEINGILPLLKTNYNTTKKSFFGNLFYTTIIVPPLDKFDINGDISDKLEQAKHKLSESIGQETIFNDAKIIPFILEILDDDKKSDFIKNIKIRALIEEGKNIVDHDAVFFAWALLKNTDKLTKTELEQFSIFANSTLSAIEGLVQTLCDETLEKLYGKNVRKKLPFYWMGYAYEFVQDFEDFLGKMTHDLHGKTLSLVRRHKLNDIEKNLTNAIDKINGANFSDDEEIQKKLSTEGGSLLGITLEGILKYALYKISKEKVPEYDGEGLDKAIGNVQYRLRKIEFLKEEESLDKLISFLRDEFRNIASHYQVEKEKLKEEKFEAKKLTLEQANICLHTTENVISTVIKRLETAEK